MRMRKLFAGLAAAATLLGGLALGTASASADDTVQVDANNVVTSTATFKFKADDANQWNGRTIKYYKLADYVQYGTGADAKYGVKTASSADRAAISTALNEAVKVANQTLTVPTDTTTDLMAWALQEGALDKEAVKPWSGSTRNFAQSLAANTTVTNALTEATLSGTGTDRTILLSAGVYLFLDTAKITDSAITEGSNGNISNGTEQNGTDINNKVGGEVVTQSAPIVLSSGTITDSIITDPLKDTSDLTNNAAGDNIISLKNHVTPVSKTFGDKDGTVSTGQTVEYTLTSELPAVTTGFTDYKFTLTDTPGVGQTVDLSKDLVVKIGDTKLKAYDATSNKTGYELSFTNLTTDEQKDKKFDGNASKQFTIDLSRYVQAMTYSANANLNVTVTYNVTINEQAKTNHEVLNTVEVNDNNSKATDKTKLTLGKFSFTKTDASGNALAGATFTITAVDTDSTNKTDAVLPSDADKTATSSDSQDSLGVVTFDGLADGVYEVTETGVPEGFLGHDSTNPTVAAKFKVTISGGKATKFDGTDAWGLAPDANSPTSDNDHKTDYKVKNVKNITQLPLTGAAGTAVFTVIGLLLAGAAAAVYAKSRSTRRALRRV